MGSHSELSGSGRSLISAATPAAESQKSTPRHYIALALLCLVAFAAMEVIALSEWKAGLWHLSDVGNVQYILVNTWGGNFMYSPAEEGNFFAFHFTPFFFLLMPLVWLSQYPIPLVTSYQLALALTPVPLYMLARRFSLSPLTGLCLGVWFLGNHFVGSLQLSNHFENFYVLFALLVMALINTRHAVPFWISAVLALSVKEDCSVWLLAYAAWEWLFNRDNHALRLRALKLGALSLVWGAMAGAMMYLASVGASNSAARYVDRMGGISIELDTLQMLLLLIATTGGLCLPNWRAALLLLVPLPIIFGRFEFTRLLQYYYSYPFLPYLAFATAAGTAQLIKWTGRSFSVKNVQLVAGIYLLILGIAQYPMVTRTNGHRRIPHKPTHRDELRLGIARDELPLNAPVALQYGLWGVVPWRHDTEFLKNELLQDRHYVFMDMKTPLGFAPEKFKVLGERLQQEVNAGLRTELYNRYDFVILSPVSDTTTTGIQTLQ